MENAFTWLRDLADWFSRFVPKWRTVPSTHGWVKFMDGKVLSGVGPKIVWWWEVTTELHLYPVVRQTVTFPTQVITTTDEKEVAVSAMLVYRIVDLEKIYAHTYDPEETTRDIAASSLHDVLTDMSWDEIRTSGRKLRTKLKNEAARDLEEYGVQPVKFALLTCARCNNVARVIRSDFIEGAELKAGG